MDRVAPTSVAVALGSNLGDRRGHLAWAIEQLAGLLGELRVSSILETDPVGVPTDQPPFLNAVVVGCTTLGARDLLLSLQELERQRGRERPYPYAPRTLDLDLIFYGDEIIDEPPHLVVPHPRFRERRFVLEPLAELSPDYRDPVTRKKVGELLGGL